MSFPYINAYQQFFDSSGSPLASGTIEFRDPTSNNLINSYPTADDADAQTNANANPLTLSSTGAASSGLFLEDGVAYKVILKDSDGNTVATHDDVRCPIALPYLLTAAESSASVTPSDFGYPELDIRRYGAALDGSTDDRTAWNNALAVVAAKGGGTLYCPPGAHSKIASALGQISLRSGVAGDFSAACTRTVRIEALGATIECTQTSGFVFNVQGTTISATSPARFELIGGSWIGTSSGGGLLKLRDGNRAAIQPEMVSNFSTGRAFLLQNWYNWSENITITGPGGSTLTLIDNKIGLEIQGSTAATAEDGTPAGSPGESFARLRAFNWSYGTASGAPVNNRIAYILGNWYDGIFESVYGNMVNRNAGATVGTTALVEIGDGGTSACGMTRTLIRDWHLEGANDGSGAAAYMFDATGSGNTDQAHPRVENCAWTGGQATVLNGWGDSLTNSAHLHHTNQEFLAPISEANWITPTGLSGNVNDYAPTGIGSATGLRIDPNGATRTITGLTEGYEGRMITIVNIGALTEDLILSDSDTNSTAANRFSLVSDITLVANQAVRLIYDGTSNRWRAMLSPPESALVEETATNIADIAAAINTTNKYRGKLVWDTTNTRLMRATAAGASGAWVVVDGSTSVTPA